MLPQDLRHSRAFTAEGEILALTGLRGLLSLWVVLAHLGLFMPALVAELGPLATISAYGDRAVDLFFMLSGLVLRLSYLSVRGLQAPYGRFVANRVARLFPLHWLMLAAYLAIYALQQFAGTESYDWHGVGVSAVEGLFLMQNWFTPHFSLNVPAWSASIEWLLYLLFPVLVFPIQRLRRSRWVAVALAVVLTLAITLPTLEREVAPLEQSWPLYATFATALRGLLPFLLGLLIHRLLQLEHRRRFGWLALPAALTLLALPFLVEDSAWLLLPGVALLLALPSAKGAVAKILSSRALVRLGDLSFALYMLHYAFFDEMPDAVARLGLDPAWLPDALTLVGLAIAVPLVHYAVEVPARRWLRRKFDYHRWQPSTVTPLAAPTVE